MTCTTVAFPLYLNNILFVRDHTSCVLAVRESNQKKESANAERDVRWKYFENIIKVHDIGNLSVG